MERDRQTAHRERRTLVLSGLLLLAGGGLLLANLLGIPTIRRAPEWMRENPFEAAIWAGGLLWAIVWLLRSPHWRNLEPPRDDGV